MSTGSVGGVAFRAATTSAARPRWSSRRSSQLSDASRRSAWHAAVALSSIPILLKMITARFIGAKAKGLCRRARRTTARAESSRPRPCSSQP